MKAIDSTDKASVRERKKKMKKKTIIFGLITMAIALTIGLMVMAGINNASKHKVGIHNIREYSIENIPEFTLTMGSTNVEQPIMMTKEEVIDKKMKVYEFTGRIDNNWDIVENEYVGIRLIDILNAYDMEYEDIEFYEVEAYSVKFKKEEIDENVFIIFFRDGAPLGEIEPISLMSFNAKWSHSLADINYIYIDENSKE